jgi:hypothetical protein
MSPLCKAAVDLIIQAITSLAVNNGRPPPRLTQMRFDKKNSHSEHIVQE